MSIRDFSPLYKWGFSIRTPKFLIPLFANNLLSAGNDAIAPLEDVTYNDNEDLSRGPIIQKRKRKHENDNTNPQPPPPPPQPQPPPPPPPPPAIKAKNEPSAKEPQPSVGLVAHHPKEEEEQEE